MLLGGGVPERGLVCGTQADELAFAGTASRVRRSLRPLVIAHEAQRDELRLLVDFAALLDVREPARRGGPAGDEQQERQQDGTLHGPMML